MNEPTLTKELALSNLDKEGSRLHASFKLWIYYDTKEILSLDTMKMVSKLLGLYPDVGQEYVSDQTVIYACVYFNPEFYDTILENEELDEIYKKLYEIKGINLIEEYLISWLKAFFKLLPFLKQITLEIQSDGFLLTETEPEPEPEKIPEISSDTIIEIKEEIPQPKTEIIESTNQIEEDKHEILAVEKETPRENPIKNLRNFLKGKLKNLSRNDIHEIKSYIQNNPTSLNVKILNKICMIFDNSQPNRGNGRSSNQKSFAKLFKSKETFDKKIDEFGFDILSETKRSMIITLLKEFPNVDEIQKGSKIIGLLLSFLKEDYEYWNNLHKLQKNDF